jgi:sugar/nucleoside kinase (ribokinase family)
MMGEMAAAGMDTSWVEVVAGAPTLFSVCFQYPDGVGGNLTTSNSAAAQLSSADVDKLEDLFGEPAVALAAPEVPLETRAHFVKMANKHGAFCAASLAAAEVAPALEMGMFGHLDLISLNEGEAAVLAERRFDPAEPQPFLRACESRLWARYPKLRVAVTAGSLGAFAFCDGAWDFSPAPRVKVASTAGAGDALLAGLIVGAVAGLPFLRPSPSLRRQSGEPLASALDMAVLLGSYKVSSPHTIHPEADMENLLAFAGRLGLSIAPSIQRLLAAGGSATSASQS